MGGNLVCDFCEKEHLEWENEQRGVPNHTLIWESIGTPEPSHICCQSKESDGGYRKITVHDAIGQNRLRSLVRRDDSTDDSMDRPRAQRPIEPPVHHETGGSRTWGLACKASLDFSEENFTDPDLLEFKAACVKTGMLCFPPGDFGVCDFQPTSDDEIAFIVRHSVWCPIRQTSGLGETRCEVNKGGEISSYLYPTVPTAEAEEPETPASRGSKRPRDGTSEAAEDQQPDPAKPPRDETPEAAEDQ